jgi:hypothetical protein
MRLRIGSALVALALVFSMTTVALAQVDNDTPPLEEAGPVGTAVAVPTMDQPSLTAALFLTLVNPVDQDIEVPLATAQLTINGVTLPGAVVSIDGDLAETDDQGNFVGVTLLNEGASEIEVVASNDQGDLVNTTIFVTRGE